MFLLPSHPATVPDMFPRVLSNGCRGPSADESHLAGIGTKVLYGIMSVSSVPGTLPRRVLSDTFQG